MFHLQRSKIKWLPPFPFFSSTHYLVLAKVKSDLRLRTAINHKLVLQYFSNKELAFSNGEHSRIGQLKHKWLSKVM